MGATGHSDELFPAGRVTAAAVRAAATGLDALLVTPGADLRYLTGYAARAGERLTCLVVPATGPATLVVPRLERPAAETSPATGAGVSIVDVADGVDPYPVVARLLGDALGRPPRRVGVANRMWAEQAIAFRDALPGTELGLAGEVLRSLRTRKSPAEVAALRRAAAAIDRVHARMAEWLRPGRTEAEVGRDIADAILAEGHAEVAFVIVAAGPNGASPHHDTSSRVIAAGEPVVVDIGGVMPDGYCSDCTRTYVLGPPPADFLAYYKPLQAAQLAGVEAVAPGVAAGDIDAACRDLLADAGYGERFIHRTGHGIGLDGHEDPYLVAGNATPLEPGMAFSIEPGVYLPGRHGARIEDIVVCTDDGVERLNTLPTDVVVL